MLGLPMRDQAAQSASAVLLLPRLADIPLQMGQRLGVGSRLLASQISKGLTKDIAVTSKKTATGWIFRQLQGGTFLGPTERKC